MNSIRSIARRLLIVVLAVTVTIPIGWSVAFATSGTWTITTDTTLVEDHYGSIMIAADNITLDCAGFSVIGPDQGDGITVVHHSGVTIRNCHVTRFAHRGIYVTGSAQMLLEGNEARENARTDPFEAGFLIETTTDSVIRDNLAIENGLQGGGFDFSGSSNTLIADNRSIRNDGSGFYTADATRNSLIGNVASENGDGFVIDEGTTGNTFQSNVATANTGRGGIFGGPSSDNRFLGNQVTDNSGYGISLTNSDGNEFVGNETSRNGLSGFYFAFDTSTVLRNNVARSNAGHGIEFEGPNSSSIVTGNVSEWNFNGFYITAENDSTFSGNVASYNQYRGFELDQLVSQTTFDANQVVGNGDNGFAVNRSDDNLFVHNDLRANGNSGILLGGRGNKVSRNQMYDNATGIQLADADQSVIALNDIVGNVEGIRLHSDSDHNVIQDNEVRSNHGTGVSVTNGSEGNRIEGNVSSHNGDSGLRVETSHNTLLANRAMSNARYGFHVSGGPANKLAFNSACNNGILDAFEDPGVKGNVWLANSFCTSDI